MVKIFIKSSIKKIKNIVFGFFVESKAVSIGKSLFVNSYSVVNRKTQLGDNVHFNGMKIRGGGAVVIGNNFHSGEECLMLTDMHNYEGTCLPYDSTLIAKPITIEDNVWFGSRVTIIGSVTVGEGAIVQAGAVVVKDVPQLAIVGGNPAKVIKERNAIHYYQYKDREY